MTQDIGLPMIYKRKDLTVSFCMIVPTGKLLNFRSARAELA